MSLPSISVIIPCFNARRWIAAALNSVLAQEWPVIEIIVVDDGSTDGATELVRAEYPQVTLLQQPNRGVAAARNRGIEHARGEWIAFVDADDIWLPGKLQAQWAMISAEPDARMAYTAWYVWHSVEPTPAPELLKELQAKADDRSLWSGPSGWIYPQLLLDCEVWTSTVLARRDLFTQIGVFDTSLRIGEDLDLWLRASRVTPILRVPRPLALYRTHPNSMTKGAPAHNYQANVIARAIERWGYTSPDGALVRKATVDRTIARTWRGFAGAHLAADNAARACRGALMSIKHDPGQGAGWILLARSALRALARGRFPR